ncbi:hypothetical protein QTO30_01590 [Yoonia sp. GPGPB17]|uniref:hypothetical protein n=1 Tax=Yoonia sp. GPGPB17 TaxID=3026147 RepID=UPI0030C0690A
MALAPIPLSPIVGTLVKSRPAPLAATMAEVDHRITGGLPSTFSLGGGFDAILVAAGGLARHWMQAEPDQVVSQAQSIGPEGATPLRLLLRSDAKLIAAVALTRGPTRYFGISDGARIALRILDWRVHAGSILKDGDFGCFIRLGWAHLATQSTQSFQAPTARRTVLHRLDGTIAAPLPADPDLGRGLAQPQSGAPGPGSGRWVGYGWEGFDG